MIQKFPVFSLILHYTLKMCWFQVENVMSFDSKITQNMAFKAFLRPCALIFIRRNKKPRAVRLEACILIGSIENSVVLVLSSVHDAYAVSLHIEEYEEIML